MNECICFDCPHQCGEYNGNSASDRAYYEWSRKKDKCEKEKIERENKNDKSL